MDSPQSNEERSTTSRGDVIPPPRTPPSSPLNADDTVALRTPPRTLKTPGTPRTPPQQSTPSSTSSASLLSDVFEEPEDAMERRYTAATTVGVRKKKVRTNWCYRCETMQTKLIRHMIAKHNDTPEVQRYLLVTDPDPVVQKRKRRVLCREITNRSNHRYNERLAATGVPSTPLPVRRSKKNRVTQFSHVVCPRCKGLVTRKYFGLHARTCKTRLPTAQPGDSGGVVKSTFLLPPLDAKYDALKTHIFPKMTKDEIGYVAQTDGLILQYGRRFFQTHQSNHQRYYVSSQMRTLADLLIRFRKAEPTRVKTLADCLDPTNFDGLCAVVREWCGLDVMNGQCRAGSVPRRLCKSLKVCSKITWFEAIKDRDLSIEQQLEVRNKHERFMALMECEWAMEVNSAADKSLKLQRMDKTDKMPLSGDVVKFFDVMTTKIKHATARLQREHDVESYTDLIKACITYLIVFNCRRPSEVVYAKVANYETTLKTKSDGMAVFTVAALKNDVKVPIIVTPVVRSAIDTLLDHRARLRAKGDLLFGKIDGTAFNGGNLINVYKAEMNLERPDDFSANGFRHYLATVSQLDPKIKHHMPKFLGHTLSTHQRFYEMPMSDIHLDVIGPSLSRLCRISDTDDYTPATDTGLPSSSSSSINYDDPAPGTSKPTATDFCPGIVPLDVLFGCSQNSSDSCTSSVVLEKQTENRVTPSPLPLLLTSPSSSPSPPLPPPPQPPQPPSSPTRSAPTRSSIVELRPRAPRPIAAESESDNDDPDKDPDFHTKSTAATVCHESGHVETSSDTDSDVLFASPIRVVRQKNKWTTPERQELYDGLPRTMLGIERAERGKIRKVWENSKFIRKRHSLQTTRIEVSKHFTRKKRIVTPVRKSILEKLNVSDTGSFE